METYQAAEKAPSKPKILRLRVDFQFPRAESHIFAVSESPLQALRAHGGQTHSVATNRGIRTKL
jgi:hypothetical protein